MARSPSIVIGAAGDDPRTLLHNVQGAKRINDGRIVVANDGSKQLLFFESDGDYLRAVGGHGDGPGEFQYLTALWLCGDSLRVYDGRLSRFSVFDLDGRFVRSFQVRLPTRPQPPFNIHCNDDGRLIFSDWGDPLRGDIVYRPQISVMVADAAGEIMGAVGKFPGHEYVNGFTEMPVFGKHTSIKLAADRAYVGTGDQYEIAAYELDGKLTTLMRKATEAPLVTDDDIERYQENVLSGISDPDVRRQRRRELDEMPYSERMPAYSTFIHDAEGNLWVQEYRPPWVERSRWTVFTPEGVMLGTIELPRGVVLATSWVEVGQIGDDFVLGVSRDELDIERIVLHRLSK